MQADLVTGVVHPPHHRMGGRIREMFAQKEESRPHPARFEQIEERAGGRRVRPVIEGKRDLGSIPPAPEHRRRRVGQPRRKLVDKTGRIQGKVTPGKGSGAGEETRTLDIFLGKEVLYQLSYTRMEREGL